MIRRSLFNNTKISRPPQFLYEYQIFGWGPHHQNASQHHECETAETTLFVVFDGETRHRFSSTRIVLYCNKKECALLVSRFPLLAHNRRGQVHHAPPNDSTLPQLVIAFKVVPHYESYGRIGLDLVLQSSDDERRNWRRNPDCVLLESELAVTSDTASMSMAFEHSKFLHTLRKELKYCCNHSEAMSSMGYGIIRIVRVVPEDSTRPGAAICRLPAELLLKIFENIDSCEWQHDLLSFAQVCRQWSCSMEVLFARLENPGRDNHSHFPWFSNRSPDPYAFAKAFTETPVLGLGIRHLVLDEHFGSRYRCDFATYQRNPTSFTPALIAILRATKDLQHLHISQVYSSRANANFSALPELAYLRTLYVTVPDCPLRYYHDNSISTIQLARCMTRWSALTSLTVEYLVPGSLGMRRSFLRPPACALTHLCFRNLHISDADLLYLTASSAHTLVQVTLEHVDGITSNGLHTFLDSISQQVTSLALIPVWRGFLMTGTTEHALDAVVDKMWCLEALRIQYDVATECMLRRRSEMFARNCNSGDAGVPVVRLSATYVPGLAPRTRDEEWPGWQIVQLN